MRVFQGKGWREAGTGRRAKTASAWEAAEAEARARRRRLERRSGEAARWPEVRRRAWHWSAWLAALLLQPRRRERRIERATGGGEDMATFKC
jgi:hypothetical protein